MPTHYDLTHCPSLPPKQQSDREPPSTLTGWLKVSDNLWVRYHPTTIAIINAASWVGLPSITPINLSEWAYRLSSLHDAGQYFISTSPQLTTGDGSASSAPLPISLSIHDIKLHIGARFTCPQLTLAAFHAQIRHLRLAPILKSLSQQEPTH